MAPNAGEPSHRGQQSSRMALAGFLCLAGLVMLIVVLALL